MQSKVAKCNGLSIYCSPSRWEIATTLQQLLSAVSFLHSNGVAHRDIKPDTCQCSEHHFFFAAGLICSHTPPKSVLELAKVAKRPRSLFGVLGSMSWAVYGTRGARKREAVAGFGWGINFGWDVAGWANFYRRG